MARIDLRAATERLIERFRAEKLAIERKLQELEAHKALLDSMSDDTISLLAGEVVEEACAKSEGTYYDRIAAFLREHDNSPQTVEAIEKGTGISRASISAVLYRTHSEEFVSQKSPGSTRAKAWRLCGDQEQVEEASVGGNGWLPLRDMPSRTEDDIPF